MEIKFGLTGRQAVIQMYSLVHFVNFTVHYCTQIQDVRYMREYISHLEIRSRTLRSIRIPTDVTMS